jgi:anthranilate synthase component 2
MPANVRILILDNNDSFTFNLVQLVEECGITSYDVVVSDRLNPIITSGYDKVLISPGPGLPDDFPRMGEVISQYGATKDILGICLGHQAIAIAFGGSLVHLPDVKHGMTTRLKILVPDRKLFNGVRQGSRVGLYHSWTVDPKTLPDCLELTAISEQGDILAIRHKHFRIRGLQFHPESFMTPSGKQILTNWLTNT